MYKNKNIYFYIYIRIYIKLYITLDQNGKLNGAQTHPLTTYSRF